MYGDVIRAYREGMTGDKSGLGIIEQPADYLPILLRIYKAAPLPIGGSFEVNKDIEAAHVQWSTFMKKRFGEATYTNVKLPTGIVKVKNGKDFWEYPNWGRFRAYMCAPFIAETVYKETYDTWKLKNRAAINAAMPNFNWQIVDNLYLHHKYT